MAISQYSNTTITPAPTHTQLSLAEAIKTHLVTAGMTFVQEYTQSNIRYVVLTEAGQDTGKTYNTIFYRVAINASLQISHQLFTAWNSNTLTGSDGSGEVNSTVFVNSTAIEVAILRSTEVSFVALLQGALFMLLGVFFPEKKHEIYDINSFPKAVISQNSTLSNWSGCSRNAFGNTNYECFPVGWNRLASPNSQYNVFAPMLGLFFGSHSNQGLMFWSSSNFGIAPGNNIPRLSIFQTPGTNGNKDCLMLGTGAGAFIAEISYV